MTMAEVRIDMETTLYEQMAAACATFSFATPSGKHGMMPTAQP